jgi:hypothetical protein
MSCDLCASEVAVYSTPVLEVRGGRQMRQKARVLTLIGVLPQLEDSGPVGVIFTMMDAGKDNPCCLTWKELVSCVHPAIQLLVYST